MLPLSALTPKDRADLEAALDAGIDWVALSFMQRPEDIAEAKKITRGRAAVMAKIEKPQAVTRLDEIIDLADALMVARGDLGVEMPLEKVPGMQKQITRACRRAGKPVVVATQMLESMITAPVPTRAEVSDVATAIFDGADAVMLSAESAAGQYPVEAVATMNRIAEEVESEPTYLSSIHAQHTEPEATGADAIAAAARQIAETLDLSAIVCWTSLRLDRPARRARAAAAADRRDLAERRRPAGSCRSPGASTASSPRTRAIRTTWWSAPAGSPSGKASPRPASASSSSPACRSARPAPPTCSASPSSGRITRPPRKPCQGHRRDASRAAHQLLDRGDDAVRGGVVQQMAEAGQHLEPRARHGGGEPIAWCRGESTVSLSPAMMMVGAASVP